MIHGWFCHPGIHLATAKMASFRVPLAAKMAGLNVGSFVKKTVGVDQPNVHVGWQRTLAGHLPSQLASITVLIDGREGHRFLSWKGLAFLTAWRMQIVR